MAKELTGYIAVAGINLMGKEEYFAIYNDGYKYEKEIKYQLLAIVEVKF